MFPGRGQQPGLDRDRHIGKGHIVGLLLQALELTPPASLSLAPDAAPGAPGAPLDNAARKEGGASPVARPSDKLDAQLGGELDTLTAVLGDINDDAVAGPLRAAMQKVIDGRAAAQAMAEAKRVVALNALLANIRKQRPVAEAARKRAQAVQSRETARKEVEVALGQVTALVLGGINDDALRNQVNDQLTKLQADFAKADKIADLAQGEKALVALKPTVLALLNRAEKAKGVTDWLGSTWQPLLAKANTAVAAVATPAIRSALQAQIATLEAEVKTRTAASDLGTLQGTVGPALQKIETSALAATAFDKAYAAIKTEVDEAALYHGSANWALTSATGVAFANAKQAVETAVAGGDWAAAKAALPALKAAAAAVRKSRDDRAAFEASYASLAADRATISAALAAPGLPAQAAAAYHAAFSAVNKETTARNWPAALVAVPAFKTAIQDALKALKDGAKFYAIYASVRPDHVMAENVARGTYDEQQANPKLAAVGAQFWLYHKKLRAAVAAPEWGDAKDLLADLQVACRDLIVEAARYSAARAPYDAEFNALVRRGEAETASEQPAPPLAAAAAAYKKQRQLVYGAESAGDFARAMAALPALQTTIDALMVVKDAQAAAATQFQAGQNALTDYAEATQASAGKAPALVEPTKAFLAADKAVDEARKAPDWIRALAALPALQAAATQLAKAAATFNAGAQPADGEAFAARLKALEPRTSKAAEAPGTAFVDTLQKAVQSRLTEADTQLAAKDLAAAEASYARLLGDLDAMEAGKARYAAHKARFDAMKNGEIAAALAVPLVPPALAAERAAAIARTEAAIVALAAKSDTLGAADAKLAFWASEAKGWKETQKAYAELHSGKVPSVDELAALAAKPGGEQALDELIMNLPANTPGKVLGACLKARFGFDVQHLESMNADVQNLKGTKAHDADAQDPELAAMYKLLAQIPSPRIKGKITELVAFDTNDGGGVYYGGGEKKIYTHAGRIGDTSDEKTFGQEGEVMPKGEQVEEDCKPAPKAPKMAVSNHTLLHEAAHAEDDGMKFMEGRWNKPEFGNWRKETPESIAKVAAPQLKYDQDWIQDVLESKDCKPPTKTPKAPKGVKPDVWEKRRAEALVWCESIRAANGIWWKGAICQRVAIGGRVYQESYNDGRWRSYDYSARAKGISGYQFRAPAEWFAELYAAYFGEKLKPSHPAMSWLVQFKPKETA